jgi:Na+-translocating ferredoxin:NAD+ oxidoreductase RnfA subunit
MSESAFQIFVNALLANNFVLAMFLGLCPFLGVSGKLDTAFPMGVATTFVMLVASLCAYGLNLLLTAFSAYHNDPGGQVFVFFIMLVAAAEVTVGLAILVMMKRNVDSVDINQLNRLKW